MPRVSYVSVGRLVGRKFSKQGQKPGIMHFAVAAASRRCRPLQPFDKVRARLPRVLAISFIVDRPRAASACAKFVCIHGQTSLLGREFRSRGFSCPAPVPTPRIRPFSTRVSHPQILRSSLRTAPLLVTGLLLVRPQS